MPMAKYSQYPNFREKVAMGPEIRTSTRPPIRPPIREANVPRTSALEGWPALAMGAPSKQVTIEDGVPGIFSRMAEIRPPEIDPT